MPEVTVRGLVGDKEVTLESGKLAMLADGAVVARIGGTEVLATGTARRDAKEGQDFFPLTVDIEERMYAAGKIPGSFFRREGRPTEKATLSARLIDRPLRPSFRSDYRCETHVVATILSVDMLNAYDVLAINAASAALTVSPIPFEGPLGAVRMSLKDGDWLPLPTYEELEESVFDLIIVGGRNAQGSIDIVMVEAGATEDGLRLIEGGQPPADEATVAAGLEASKEYIGQMIDLQDELRSQYEEVNGILEVEWPVVVDYDEDTLRRVTEIAEDKIRHTLGIIDKKERLEAERQALEATLAEMGLAAEDADPAAVDAAKKAYRSLHKTMMRERVVKDGVRLDGRKADEIRPLSAAVGVVSKAHGSGLFQRGETQVLNVATLGMLRMEQMLDTISIEETKRYMHHYNFPPFSTGETGFMRGPKRREIGHGALAERAVLPVVPTADEFPYAFRLVSEVLMSNGSSSMASVCGSSLSLMDAGVPIIEPVAGIAMGVIAHEDGFVTLTDILGAEDALGDMDFKVAGTAGVITALQLDTKIAGLPAEVLTDALEQAKRARLEVLAVMKQAIPGPREELNANAPRIEAVKVPKDKIGEVIGPKGKMIREIEEETGATLDIEDDGTIRIGAVDGQSMQAAKDRVLAIAFPPEAEVGKEYEGEVVNITKFGAFVNILPGRDGLLHISKIGGSRRIDRVEDELSLGDKIQVVVREIKDGKVSLDLPGGDDGGGQEPDGDKGRRDRSGDDRSRDRERSRDGDDRRKPRRRQPADAATTQGSGQRTKVSFEDEFEGGI